MRSGAHCLAIENQLIRVYSQACIKRRADELSVPSEAARRQRRGRPRVSVDDKRSTEADPEMLGSVWIPPLAGHRRRTQHELD
jgi:hypothetical protein